MSECQAINLRSEVHDRASRYKCFSVEVIGNKAHQLLFAATDQLQQLEIALSYAKRKKFSGIDGALFRLYGVLANLRGQQNAAISIWEILGEFEKGRQLRKTEFKSVRDICHMVSLHGENASQIYDNDGKKRAEITSFVSYSEVEGDEFVAVVEEVGNSPQRLQINLLELINKNDELLCDQLNEICQTMSKQEVEYKKDLNQKLSQVKGWGTRGYLLGKLAIDPFQPAEAQTLSLSFLPELQNLFAQLKKVIDETSYSASRSQDVGLVIVGLNKFSGFINDNQMQEAYIHYCGIRVIAEGVFNDLNSFLCDKE